MIRMANREQLEIIKQGAEVWSRWRLKHPDVKFDLSGADLRDVNFSGAVLRDADLRDTDLRDAELLDVDLSGADLNNADLNSANLINADLSRADFSNANLKGAILINANLSGADLINADLNGAMLTGAILNGAILNYANLKGAGLNGANLSDVDLRGAILGYAFLSQANLSNSRTGSTSFVNVDLSSCLGLETITHHSPSDISTSTMNKSKGKIPVKFLRGCGLSDWEIESAKLYNPELSNQDISELQYKIYDLRATRPIQVSPLFISYSHADSVFVDELGKKLTEMGIRYWRDIHDMKSGRMEKQVDRALRLNPTVLVVLSKHSIKSDWVEHEVNSARELEKELNRDCLCPVALDDSWMSSPWDQRIMRQVKKYNILDFSSWQDKSTFGTTFKKLVDGLQLFYK